MRSLSQKGVLALFFSLSIISAALGASGSTGITSGQSPRNPTKKDTVPNQSGSDPAAQQQDFLENLNMTAYQIELFVRGLTLGMFNLEIVEISQCISQSTDALEEISQVAKDFQLLQNTSDFAETSSIIIGDLQDFFYLLNGTIGNCSSMQEAVSGFLDMYLIVSPADLTANIQSSFILQGLKIVGSIQAIIGYMNTWDYYSIGNELGQIVQALFFVPAAQVRNKQDVISYTLLTGYFGPAGLTKEVVDWGMVMDGAYDLAQIVYTPINSAYNTAAKVVNFTTNATVANQVLQKVVSAVNSGVSDLYGKGDIDIDVKTAASETLSCYKKLNGTALTQDDLSLFQTSYQLLQAQSYANFGNTLAKIVYNHCPAYGQ